MVCFRNLQFGIVILFFLVGCTTIRTVTIEDKKTESSGILTPEDFERVLQRFVDERGFVDYGAPQNDSHDIDRYYLLLSTYSPDSHPELF